ncbi:MAG: PqqD family protein, partial [Oscillospiraceae bacterium]|nr:PqqD family protein [Oscillospiraceae bacterium]
GNERLGEILSLMKNDTTEGEIVRRIGEKYEAPEGKIEQDVHRVVTELRRIGAIVD